MKATNAALVLFALLLVAPEAARADHLHVGPVLDPVVARGLAASPTFRDLWGSIADAPEVRLRVVTRFQPSSAMRAHSELRVTRPAGGRDASRAAPVAVGGEVVIPPDVTDARKIALLAHELAHVRELLGHARVRSSDEERIAVAVERRVLAELSEDLRLEDRQARAAPAVAAESRLEGEVLEEGREAPPLLDRHLR